MKIWIKNNWYIILAIIFVVGFCFALFVWNEWFFGTEKKCFLGREIIMPISEIFKYIGAIIGGILLIINAYLINKRVKEQNRNNNLVAKGQLDTRFKDAATLLASENTSANLSGIHALHQIAVEASKTKDQQDYVKVIKDILIAFIKDNSVIEYIKDEKGMILSDKFGSFIAEKEKTYNIKSNVVLQTIIDKLFRENSWEIYAKYPTDLSKTVLKEINFSCAKLQDVVFDGAQLQHTLFSNVQLQDTHFCFVGLQSTRFLFAELQGTKFVGDDIDKAIFVDVSWNKKTGFIGTAFGSKTIEELTKIMGNPPTPLE